MLSARPAMIGPPIDESRPLLLGRRLRLRPLCGADGSPRARPAPRGRSPRVFFSSPDRASGRCHRAGRLPELPRADRRRRRRRTPAARLARTQALLGRHASGGVAAEPRTPARRGAARSCFRPARHAAGCTTRLGRIVNGALVAELHSLGGMDLIPDELRRRDPNRTGWRGSGVQRAHVPGVLRRRPRCQRARLRADRPLVRDQPQPGTGSDRRARSNPVDRQDREASPGQRVLPGRRTVGRDRWCNCW